MARDTQTPANLARQSANLAKPPEGNGAAADGAGEPGARRASSADRVGAIVAAAEAAAETIRTEAETRARDRIAESDRAAQYRVTASEEEAAEILETARAQAQRLRTESHRAAEEAKTTATSESLAILDTARRAADETLEKATQAAAAAQREAERSSRELLSEARVTAEDVRREGLELGANLREMGNSLRFNSERLLRDVAQIHGQLTSRIDRVDKSARRSRDRGGPSRRSGSPDDDDLDVPEFMPRS